MKRVPLSSPLFVIMLIFLYFYVIFTQPPQPTPTNRLTIHVGGTGPYKHEVDIIQPNDTPHPIEIKYGKIDTKNLLTFMKKYHIAKGQIISLTIEQKFTHENKQITITPAFKYLLQ